MCGGLCAFGWGGLSRAGALGVLGGGVPANQKTWNHIQACEGSTVDESSGGLLGLLGSPLLSLALWGWDVWLPDYWFL